MSFFVQNKGQFRPEVLYQCRMDRGVLHVTESALWLTMLESGVPRERPRRELDFRENRPANMRSYRGVNLRLTFAGVKGYCVEPRDSADTTVSYFRGSAECWKTGVPVWNTLCFSDGGGGAPVKLAFSSGKLRLCPEEDDRPAVPCAIRLEGAKGVRVDGSVLTAITEVGNVELPFMPVDAQTSIRAVHSNILEIGFVAAYKESADFMDRTEFGSLAEDFVTYLGGSGWESGVGVASGPAGSCYVTGWTDSPDLPTSPGAFEGLAPPLYGMPGPGGEHDAFVARFVPASRRMKLRYLTYLGGESGDAGRGIAVDRDGVAYVTGFTYSKVFPVTPDALMRYAPGLNVFYTKLDPTGSSLVYSTVLGGNDLDAGFGIAIDEEGSAYIAGDTWSPDFPATAGAFGPRGGADAFVVKFDSTGRLAYATIVAGAGSDNARGIAVDTARNAYVAGSTHSRDFYLAGRPFDDRLRGDTGAFVFRLDPLGVPVYSTFLGGRVREFGKAIAVDPDGNAYVTGSTESPDFPVTPDAYQTVFLGGATSPPTTGIDADAFVTKLTPDGSSLLYSTFLAGTDEDYGTGIQIDADRRAYVVGMTFSSDFPVTTARPPSVTSNAFVAVLSPEGKRLLFGDVIGGSDSDGAAGVAVNQEGIVFLTGQTASRDFPVSDRFSSLSGLWDAFLIRMKPIPVLV
jgi:hypothetical protein